MLVSLTKLVTVTSKGVNMTKEAETKRHLRRQRNRKVTSAVATGFVILTAFAAVAAGSSVLTDRAKAKEQFEVAQATPVSAKPIEMSAGFVVARDFLGQVEATRSAEISFELGGLITALAVKEGDLVSKGEVVARLDTALLEAEHNRLAASRQALEAQLEFAESQLARAQILQTEGFASEETVEQTIARRDELDSRIRELDAALAAVDINRTKSTLRAPFSGRVGAQFRDTGETVAAGNPIVSVIETGPPEIRVGLPLSVDLVALTNTHVRIDGLSHRADLIRVRPDIDPVTRTRTALFRLTDEIPVLDGQTVTLSLKTTIAEPGAWVALDALSAGANGAWNVLVVDGEETVRSALVEVLHVDAGRAFIRGTFPANARIVTTGGHRVVPGQRVTVLIARL